MIYFDEMRDFASILETLGNLPNYLVEEFIYDEERKTIIKEAINTIHSGGKVIITGKSGCGKTALMAVILALVLKTGKKVGVIKEGASIGKEHIDMGVILFYDDLNKLDEQTLIGLAKTRSWIATLREEEYPNIARRAPEIFQETTILKINPMRKSNLEKMLERYSYREGIIVQPLAKQAIIEKALIDKERGLPQYIWLVIRDARIRGITQITQEFVREIPRSILSYTETIIARAIGDAEWEDKVTTLAILMMMADAPGYAMEEELIYELYELSTGKSGSQALANIARYLVRSGGKLKIPHDSWIDVLRKPDIIKYEAARARKRYEELKELMGVALERIRIKKGKAEQALQTVLATETKRILRELEEAKEEIVIERPREMTIPTATPIDMAREYIRRNPYVKKDAIPRHLKEPIIALAKMGEIVEGKKHYYHREYWEKIVKKIANILDQGKTIAINKITPIANPSDIIRELKAYIVGQYIISRKWLQQKIVDTIKLTGKITTEQLAKTLKVTQSAVLEISMQTPEAIIIGKEIWYKPYYKQKINEVKKLRKLGYTRQQIIRLTGVDIAKIKKSLKQTRKIDKKILYPKIAFIFLMLISFFIPWFIYWYERTWRDFTTKWLLIIYGYARVHTSISKDGISISSSIWMWEDIPLTYLIGASWNPSIWMGYMGIISMVLVLIYLIFSLREFFVIFYHSKTRELDLGIGCLAYTLGLIYGIAGYGLLLDIKSQIGRGEIIPIGFIIFIIFGALALFYDFRELEKYYKH